jgi:hypothetical protein
MTQDEIKVLELEALIEDLRLNHEYCPKEVILQAADELERLSQRTEQNFCPRCGKRTNDIHTCTPPQRSESSGKPSAWVGLTDEEIDKTHETHVWDARRKVWNARRSYARAIEAKLKEKNT